MSGLGDFPVARVLGVVGLIGVVVLGLNWLYRALLLGSDRRSAHHRSTARDAFRLRKKLINIGREHGIGAQFGYLRKINPFVFEELVLVCLETQGHAVKRNDSYTGDGGIDGQVYIDGRWHLLQMKRYSKHINASHVQEFARCCAGHNQPGLFIHTGRTGEKAWRSVSGLVKIMSGQKMIQFLGIDTESVK